MKNHLDLTSESVFTPAHWTAIAAKIAAAYRLTAEEAARLEANRTARLVAALPFVAGCAEPERAALSHLAVFVLASTESCRHEFDHKAADDVDPLRRLAPIADFQGGDPAVLDRGMRLLAIVMTNGYRKDLAKDAKSGEYNPLLAGAWNADRAIAELAAPLLHAGPSPLDGIMSVAEALRGFWEM